MKRQLTGLEDIWEGFLEERVPETETCLKGKGVIQTSLRRRIGWPRTGVKLKPAQKYVIIHSFRASRETIAKTSPLPAVPPSSSACGHR